MKFFSRAQEKAHHEALNRRFRAAAFDVDGTLTKLAKPKIPHELIQALAQIPAHIPLAICTGRDVDHVQTKLGHICDAGPAGHHDKAESRGRWAIFCENGGAGYTFDCKTRKYKQIFEIPWPEKIIRKEVMAAFLKDRLGWHSQIQVRDYSLVLRFPDYFYLFPRMTRLLSARALLRVQTVLREMKLDKDFVVQDSGIGNVIFPKESGKGKAIALWAKQLKIPLKDILVVGDKADRHQNDEELLSGHFGTPFSVGSQVRSVFPLPVLDERGRKVWGPEGTLKLLGQVKFSTRRSRVSP